ncbi:hypothetical protein [Subtercola frigoramans]|uniref:Membrane protein YdbS with pleckstrin-like domain n=1 Tax=Subtercola frigoramans TaxID=120298 RepID=A0ABS2L043_9MICO|nr:hypothetical protein [Subtercola frigoramans]MBM7470433.1 membrane protein YdbS with pleckstrin-like domain [Subtercola frigoramans]
MDPTRRLMFWLKIPYAADAALVVIGIALIAGGQPVGWWVLVFAAVRAVVGTIALVWVAPRMIARRRPEGPPPSSPRDSEPPGGRAGETPSEPV